MDVRAIAVLIVATAIIWARSGTSPNTTLPQIDGHYPVLVLQFENQTQTSELDWLREGLSDMVIADLSRSPHINVLSRQQVTNLAARAGWNQKAPLPLEDALKIAKRARARILLLGSFAKLGDKIRVTVQIHREDGSFVKTESAAANEPGQLINAVGILSAMLMRDLGAEVPKRHDANPLPITSNLEAYRYYSLGIERLTFFEVPEGIQLLQHAVALDPQFAVAYSALGNAYTISSGQPTLGKPYYEKAFQFANRLTERDRQYITAGYALANSDYEEAVKAFRRIILAYPSDVQAFRGLAKILEGEARYREALEIVQQGIAADPDEPSLYNFPALYCHLGRCEEGIAAAKLYVELTRGESNAFDSLGTAYAWTGRYGEAEQAYAAAISRKPDFFIPRFHLAVLHYWQGRYSNAIAECERLVTISPSVNDKIRALDCIGLSYYRRGETAKSQGAVARIPGRLSNTALQMAFDRQDALAARKSVDFAYDLSARGQRLSPRYRLWFLGEMALLEGKSDEAIAHFRELLAQPEPTGALDWREDSLGNAFLRLGRLDEAIAEYQRVLVINPNHALVRYHLAVAYERRHDAKRSQDEYRRFLEIWRQADPDIPEVLAARAAVHIR